MSTVNKAIVLGHVGKDPEFPGASGTIATFSMATSEHWKDRETGERKERTQWHRVVVFDENLIKIVREYVKKGSRLYVEGQNETRSFEGEGGKRYVTEIVLRPFRSRLLLMDKKEGGVPPPTEDNRQASGAPAHALNDELNDEIPF